MIRKLEEKDSVEVLKFLNTEPEINLFIIGDIENYGFDSSFQDLWAIFRESEMIAVLLRYRTNFIPFFKDYSLNIDPFVKIILSFDGNRAISGRKIITDLFKEKLTIYREKNTYFCKLKEFDATLEITDTFKVKLAKIESCKRIADFLNTIPEFGKREASTLKDKIKYQAGRIYYIEDEKNDILATALTSAETNSAAMIGGVATKGVYRQKGLASECVVKLCAALLKENKSLCLFYDNPTAGNIYKRIGFKDIDKWTMLFLK